MNNSNKCTLLIKYNEFLINKIVSNYCEIETEYARCLNKSRKILRHLLPYEDFKKWQKTHNEIIDEIQNLEYYITTIYPTRSQTLIAYINKLDNKDIEELSRIVKKKLIRDYDYEDD